MSALLDRLIRVDLQVVVVAPPDAVRSEARDRSRAAAIAAGRGQLLTEAIEASRDIAMRAFAQGGFSGTWAATDMSVSVVRAGDRVAAAAAFEEAAIAAVVEDLVDNITLEVLRSSSDTLLRLTGLPAPGALSNLGAPRQGVLRRPLIVALAVLFLFGAIAIWIVVGSWSGVIAVVVGIGIIGSLVRNETQPID